MKYCRSCGEEIHEGDKFCNNCGMNQYIDYEDKIKTSVILKKMIFCPVEGAKEFIRKGSKKFAIMLTIIIMLMQGLLGIWRINHVYLKMEQLVGSMVKTIANILSQTKPDVYVKMSSGELENVKQNISQVKRFIDIPYRRIFIQNFSLMLIMILIIFLMLILFKAIFYRGKYNCFNVYKMAVVVMVPLVYFGIFSCIFSYISFNLGIIIMFIGIIASLVYFITIIREELELNGRQCIYCVSISILLLAAVMISFSAVFIYSNIDNISNSFKQNVDYSDYWK